MAELSDIIVALTAPDAIINHRDFNRDKCNKLIKIVTKYVLDLVDKEEYDIPTVIVAVTEVAIKLCLTFVEMTKDNDWRTIGHA